MKLNILGEELVKISDNQVGSLKHHVNDALEALEDEDFDVVKASLKDIGELSDDFTNSLSDKEKSEL